MSIENFFPFLYILIPGVLIIVIASRLFKMHTQNSVQMLRVEILKQNNQSLSQLRLQAYERLSLLLERTSIPQLIHNFGGNVQTASEFKALSIKLIQEEFNYNLSQQIYVSEETWNAIKLIKEQTLVILQNTERELGPQAPVAQFCMKLISTLQETGDIPHEKGLKMIKGEIQVIFG